MRFCSYEFFFRVMCSWVLTSFIRVIGGDAVFGGFRDSGDFGYILSFEGFVF